MLAKPNPRNRPFFSRRAFATDACAQSTPNYGVGVAGCGVVCGTETDAAESADGAAADVPSADDVVAVDAAAAGVATGAGDADGVAAVSDPFGGSSMTLAVLVRARVKTERLSEVTKKRTAAPTVTLLKNVAAPRPPKTVWLDPPKAAPMSAPFPDCNSTAPTITRQFTT